jgi:hypothetical protein
MKLGKAFSLFLFLCLVSPVSTVKADKEETLQDPRLGRIYKDIRRLLRQHYPDAVSHRLKNKIHFEFNTRLFIIHVPTKMGDWQDPWEERGPRKGGILGKVEIVDGKYMGAAMVPQSFDYRYFSIMLMAPYSIKNDCHLTVHLSIPRLETKPDFIEEFTELVNDFENRIEVKP